MALELLAWSRDVILCTNEPATLTGHERQRLARHGIKMIEEKIDRFEGNGDRFENIVFQDGRKLGRRAMFFYPEQFQKSILPEKLGCELDKDGALKCDGRGSTTVPDVYVAGNARRGLQFVIIATAEGTEAAFHINTELQEADFA